MCSTRTYCVGHTIIRTEYVTILCYIHVCLTFVCDGHVGFTLFVPLHSFFTVVYFSRFTTSIYIYSQGHNSENSKAIL